MIDVLFEGIHTNHAHPDGHYSIDPLGSSVTLIEHDGVFILYDTSSYAFKERLLEALSRRGLKPSDIHHVVNSHYHLDHCFNDHLFAKTAFIHTANATLYPDGSVHVYPNPSLRPLPNGITLIKTPGHTGPDVSLMYEWKDDTWMCVGDAIREDIIRREAHLTAADPEAFLQSMQLIFNRADKIIPGHGRIIQGPLKSELHALVKAFELPSHVSD